MIGAFHSRWCHGVSRLDSELSDGPSPRPIIIDSATVATGWLTSTTSASEQSHKAAN
jgi:hypothetical protein